MAAEPDIRPATPSDAADLVKIGRELIADGTTYALDPDLTDAELRDYWLGPKARTYVAQLEGRVGGVYLIRANQAGPGRHVANAAYAVASWARGNGLGRAMGEHSLQEARRLGYRAMQFNFVVSTNRPAVELWKSLGFQVVGTLPKVFEHPTQGLVDAYVMHRFL